MKCEEYGKDHDGSYGSGRFCSDHCRRVYSGKKVNINGNHKCNFNNKARRSKYGRWKCKWCGLIFETRAQLASHIWENHHLKYGPHGKGQKIWNKGLTKKSDIRIEKSVQKLRNGYKSGRLKPAFKNKHHSKETKLKLRYKMCNWLNSLPNTTPKTNYNPKSILILEQIAKEHGWNIQHAENGGEFYTGIGYFVDAYDKEKNIVIEYDEKRHYEDVENNILIQKDLIRQKEIIDHLHCEFWRYNEETKKLWKVN